MCGVYEGLNMTKNKGILNLIVESGLVDGIKNDKIEMSNAICPEIEHREFIPRKKATNQITIFAGKHGGAMEIMELYKYAFNKNMSPVSGRYRETAFRCL
jgi:hypothetical protein